MKKFICALIAVCMLATTFAVADSVMTATGDTKAKLEAMIPVLDSLAISLNVDQDETDDDGSALRLTYSTADTGLVWSQLKNVAANWLSLDPELAEVDEDNNVIVVQGATMDAVAAASFQSLLLAPMPPEDEELAQGMTYDQADDVYLVDLTESDGHYIVIDRTAQDGDALLVKCTLYEGETDRWLGELTARLQPAAVGSEYPYSVTDAHASRTDDFNGLWATECNIRYVAPAVSATPTVTPTPTPKPTKKPSGSSGSSGTAYRRLAEGSRGDDVKALQNRLNKLGYKCGTADGIFGSGTKTAVMAFQEAIGVEQDGVATASVQKKLFSSGAPEYDTYSTLKKGSSGERVKRLQRRLRDLGYTGHPVDGKFDSRIKDAVSLFQLDIYMKETGIADSSTQKALYASDAPYCEHFIDLEKDDSGSRVYEMQRQLQKLGYILEATEKYDKGTVKAVAAFMDSLGYSGSGKTAELADRHDVRHRHRRRRRR